MRTATSRSTFPARSRAQRNSCGRRRRKRSAPSLMISSVSRRKSGVCRPKAGRQFIADPRRAERRRAGRQGHARPAAADAVQPHLHAPAMVGRRRRKAPGAGAPERHPARDAQPVGPQQLTAASALEQQPIKREGGALSFRPAGSPTSVTNWAWPFTADCRPSRGRPSTTGARAPAAASTALFARGTRDRPCET